MLNKTTIWFVTLGIHELPGTSDDPGSLPVHCISYFLYTTPYLLAGTKEQQEDDCCVDSLGLVKCSSLTYLAADLRTLVLKRGRSTPRENIAAETDIH